MRLRSLFLLLVIAGLLPAEPASARTLVVDDDVGCADARFSTIQAAVDAADPGDTVRVCAGTYREFVRIDDNRIRLRARTPRTAVIMAPDVATDRTGPLVALYGVRSEVNGFTLSGPSPVVERPSPLSSFCSTTEAIVASGGLNGETGVSAVIRNNRFVDLSCPLNDTTAIVVDTGAARALIFDNDIGGYTRRGIFIFTGAATINRNQITGPGGGATGIFQRTSASKIQANTINSNGFAGIFVDGFDTGSSTWIAGNTLRDNGSGIVLSFLGVGKDDPRLSRVEHNRVFDSADDGIVNNGSVATVLLRNNRSLGNGGFDCFDTGGGQWRGNVGVTDSPSTICSPP